MDKHLFFGLAVFLVAVCSIYAKHSTQEPRKSQRAPTPMAIVVRDEAAEALERIHKLNKLPNKH